MQSTITVFTTVKQQTPGVINEENNCSSLLGPNMKIMWAYSFKPKYLASMYACTICQAFLRVLVVPFLFFFLWYCSLNQGLVLARKAANTWAMPQPCFALVIFQIEPSVFANIQPQTNPPTFASHKAGIADVYHHAHLICWDGGV
jgi:hypothetical protein